MKSKPSNRFVVLATAILIVTWLACVVPSKCNFESAPGPSYTQKKAPPWFSPSDIGALVDVPGGRFMIGSNAPPLGEALRTSVKIGSSYPEHGEEIPGFRIGKYEVTAAEYCCFLNESVAEGKDTSKYVMLDDASTIVFEDRKYVPAIVKGYYTGGETTRGPLILVDRDYINAPALHVQYAGAKRYCEWLSEKTGHVYCLPTEVQWERAARGMNRRTFPWGEELPLGRAFLWRNYLEMTHCNRFDRQGRPSGHTWPEVCSVGSFPSGATPEDIFDLAGNAAEWCRDFYYDYGKEGIPVGEEGSTVFRGKQYLCDPLNTPEEKNNVPSYVRFLGGSEECANVRGVGFRIVQEFK